MLGGRADIEGGRGRGSLREDERGWSTERCLTGTSEADRRASEMVGVVAECPVRSRCGGVESFQPVLRPTPYTNKIPR
eukprot:715043-Hanusia_phi.AAC.1